MTEEEIKRRITILWERYIPAPKVDEQENVERG